MSTYTKEDGKKLLRLARESIEEEFSGKKPEILEKLKEKKFQEKRGVFVTLKKKGELRGCIGFPYPSIPLAEAIQQAAKSSAYSDPRFFPLQKSELKDIEIEISILTLPKKCKPEEIEIGKDGLMCEYNRRSGLLLPQVAVEWRMSREEFLEALCEKAGLSSEAWKKPGFRLYKFQAEIFSEKNL